MPDFQVGQLWRAGSSAHGTWTLWQITNRRRVGKYIFFLAKVVDRSPCSAWRLGEKKRIALDETDVHWHFVGTSKEMDWTPWLDNLPT